MNLQSDNYAAAGWLSITSAILSVPLMVLSIIQIVKRSSGRVLMPIGIILLIVVVGLSMYAIYKFRKMLNRQYNFHLVDTLISVLIAGGVLITLERILFRMVYPKALIPLIILLAVTGIPLSIVGILFAVRLMKLDHDLNGMLKPIAYTYMAASICFLSVVLSDFGFLFLIAYNVFLGLALIKAGTEQPIPDFV